MMSRKFGYIFGLLSGLFWALNGITYENLNQQFPFTQSLNLVLFLLFITELVGLIVSATSISIPKIKSHQSKVQYLFAISGGIIGAPIGMFCYLQAIQYIGVGYTAPISSIYPLIGSILSFIFFKEYLSKLGILGLFIALSCAISLSLNLNQSQTSILGFTFALICALSWGSEIILSACAMKKISSNETYFLRQLGATLGYLILLLYSKVDIENAISHFQNMIFLKTFILIILFSILSYFCYFQAIYILQPIKAMMLNMTYGFWTVFIHKLLSNENIYDIQLLLAFGLLLGTSLNFIKKREYI